MILEDRKIKLFEIDVTFNILKARVGHIVLEYLGM